jgi:hypothetical protein
MQRMGCGGNGIPGNGWWWLAAAIVVVLLVVAH